MTETPVEEMSFEAALAELEQVVGRLEGGDVPLEQSIDLYQRGNALAKRCEDALRKAEMQVEQITTDASGAATGTAPLDG
ncbi:MAG: exodeoxyribonuclease VII small subunit [Pseudomonadota bacterium]